MKNKVRAFTQPFAGKIWDTARHTLQACGVHQEALLVLGPLCTFVINEMLVFGLDKIAAAAYKVDVKALKRNIKNYFRKGNLRFHPAPVLVV